MATISLAVSDWNASRRVDLADVPSDLTIGEIITEVRNALSLPNDTPYHLVHKGEKLTRGATLDEVGVENQDEITIAPEVSAG